MADEVAEEEPQAKVRCQRYSSRVQRVSRRLSDSAHAEQQSILCVMRECSVYTHDDTLHVCARAHTCEDSYPLVRKDYWCNSSTRIIKT